MASKRCFALLSALLVHLVLEPTFASNNDCEDSEQKVQVPTDCGRVPNTVQFYHRPDRISSGYDAQRGQFPSYAQLYSSKGGRRVRKCGGTIITDRHILTAAHCLNGTVDSIKIGLGIGGVSSSSKQYKSQGHCISSRYSHPAVDLPKGGPHSVYDVGIIKLRERIQFGPLVQPVCLPDSTLGRAKQAYAIGMGVIAQDLSTNKLTRPTRLQVLPVARTSCDHKNSHDSVLCAISNEPSFGGMICIGDSGGPLLSLDERGRQTIYGISSYGDIKCRPMRSDDQVSGYFADVHNLRSEISRLFDECG